MEPFFVAELSCNHLGSFDRAVALVEAAAKAGADGVKLQTYTPSQMCEPDFVIASGPWAGRNLLGLYTEAHTPREWHKPLFARAKELGMDAFSSVFHKDDVDFLEKIGCEVFKISSFEILDLPLIRHAAKTGKPLVISTGMASEEEIRAAASEALDASRGQPATILKCVSAYPATVEDMNLRAMQNLYRYGKYGLSDHTLGSTAAIVATTLGASMIEKHLTLSRSDGGPDAAFSSEPDEFAAMVVACREAHAALGEVRYGPTPSEMSSLPLRRLKGGKRGSV